MINSKSSTGSWSAGHGTTTAASLISFEQLALPRDVPSIFFFSKVPLVFRRLLTGEEDESDMVEPNVKRNFAICSVNEVDCTCPKAVVGTSFQEQMTLVLSVCCREHLFEPRAKQGRRVGW